MFRMLSTLAALATLSACAPPTPGCGLLACVSSPYTRARGGQYLVGQPIMAVISAMGGAPTSSVDVGGGRTVMTWSRRQNDADVGMMACDESVGFLNGVAAGYQARGNCG